MYQVAKQLEAGQNERLQKIQISLQELRDKEREIAQVQISANLLKRVSLPVISQLNFVYKITKTYLCICYWRYL